MTTITRLGWIGTAAILGIAWAASGWPRTGPAPDESTPAAVPGRVGVQYELVSARLVHEPEAPVLPHAPVTRITTRKAAPPVRAARHQPAGPIRRILLGDGQNRPEPFPTVDKQRQR